MAYYNRGLAKQAKEKHAEAALNFTKSIRF